MTETAKTPEAGVVADAVDGNWVDSYAPGWTKGYLRLSRADRPIGTWLLFFPCIWGMALAAIAGGDLRAHDLWIVIGCGLGAFLMRGAGCTWNDITDRDFDAQVARTRSRPLPSGQVSVRGAVAWMVLQAVIAFGILLTFNWATIIVGVSSLIFVAIYPFAKRFTWWPQTFLGLAFNWGALVGWTAHSGSLGWPAVVLYASGIAWTLFYDTIYAHQDAEDDALIGVKSTARLFGENTPQWLMGFAALTLALLSLAIVMVADGPALWLALLAPVAMATQMLWQLRRFDANNGVELVKLFRSNRDAGFFVALFLAGGAVLTIAMGAGAA